MPRFRPIPRFVNTTITTYQKMLGIGRVNPHTMVVYMFGGFPQYLKGFTPIVRNLYPRIHGVNRLCILWVYHDLLIIITTGAIIPLFFPTGSAIGTHEKTTFTF